MKKRHSDGAGWYREEKEKRWNKRRRAREKAAMETRSAVYAQTAKKAVETQTLCTLTPSSHTQHAQTEKKEPGNVFSSSAQPPSSSTNTIGDFKSTSNAQETHKSEIQHTHRANSSHFCILQKQSHQHIRVCYCIAHTQHTTHNTHNSATHSTVSHTQHT